MCDTGPMLGFRLFRHAVLMLVDNLGPAFRVSLAPFAGVALAAYMFLSVIQGSFTTLFVVVILICLAMVFATFCWVAASWHRYVLLEEEPGAFAPAWNGPVINAYAGAAIRVFGKTLLVAVPLGILMAVLSGGNFNSNAGGPLSLVFNTLISYLSIRWSLALPAAAIGQYMTTGESWRLSKPFAGPVFLAMVCVNLLTMIPGILAGSAIGSALGEFAYFTVASWLQLMLSVSLLTALYGHIVQGRDLR